MIGTSDGEQYEDEWSHLVSQIEGGPELASMKKTTIEQRGRPTIELPPAPGGPGGQGRSIYSPTEEMQNSLTSYAQGKMTSKEVQSIFKKEGWSLDMRRGRYDFEVFDPAGGPHYIAP